MSWISDGLSSYISGLGNVYKGIVNAGTGGNGYARDVSDFIEREMVNKSDLRGSQVESVLSGVPLLGGVLKGVEGAEKLEDLYNNTGKTSAYPATNNSGASAAGLGKSLPGIARKIEGGINDLFEFYTGEKDLMAERLDRR